MKTKYFAAFVAALILFLGGTQAHAAPLQAISSGGDFGPASVVEVPGTYPPITHVYGGSSRGGLSYTEFGVLTSSDGFATNPTWQAMTGIVGYSSVQVNSAIVTCPVGQSCGGYKAFYIISSPETVYRCTGLSGVKDLSGCALWPLAGFTGIGSTGIGLDQTGEKLLINAGKAGDTTGQIYSIDIATSTATKLTTCSDPGSPTSPNGSIVGEGANRFLYVWYNSAHYRLPWNGTTCSGPRSKVDGGMGWDNAVDSGIDGDFYAAVGKLSGTFYLARTDGTFFISKKNASCNDSYISGAEKCDPVNATPLNGQTCLSVPGGFTGGTLACDAITCDWNTSSCTSPATCGDLTCNGAETCSTCPGDCGVCPPVCGDLTCNGAETCSTCPGDCGVCPPVCGDLTCNGAETCSTCPSDCGICCGNGVINSGEACDGPSMGGATCDIVMGGGWGGSISCKSDCTFDTSSCTPPLACGNGVLDAGEACDGEKLGGKTCTSELGEGWGGALSCSSCSLVTGACTFGWGLKNLIGACSLGGSGVNQSISFSGGSCTADYWPVGALTATKLTWMATAGKVLPIAVAHAGDTTTVSAPQGVSHTQVVDNGNKYETTMGGTELGVEGTTYSAEEKSYPIVLFTCTDGAIRLSFTGTSIAAINVDGTPGRLPAGYGVEVNVQTGAVTKAPYKLDGTGGDGGAGGDGGSGGDAGTGGDAGSGGDTGIGGSGGDGGGNTGASGGNAGDDSGCSMAAANSGSSGSTNPLLMLGALLAFFARRGKKG